ncbi:MAG: CBS domain-containing protein [Proteobacteria bacterium]|nr:CBS domain-containing protein [Pseudomonadota bacterium]
MSEQNTKKSLFIRGRHRLGTAVEYARMTEHTFMILIALLIGITAGLGAIGIRASIQYISGFSFPGGGDLLFDITNSPWYLKLLIPCLGGLIVGPIIHFLAPEAKGTGVPEVMLSIFTLGGRIRPRVAFLKAIVSSITIGTGGSVGREGPIIQIGASLASTIGQFFKISGSRGKTLVGCGAAAGIAAAFNAPIAGVLFAIEIILMDFAISQFSPIVISSVIATVISHYFEGNFAAFQIPAYQYVHFSELFFYTLLGLICGVVASLFIKIVYSIDYGVNKFVPLKGYLKPAVGGLLVGAIAIFFPQVMGVGYGSINLALHGKIIGLMAFALIFVKIFATSCTLGFGGSGGIFAPSLFVGAMLGSFFGSMTNLAFPLSTASPGAYALVAMGGIVAGTTRAPITAIIIIFELTNSYDVILPLMITCILSTIISSKISSESIYTIKLLSKNIDVMGKTETNAMKALFVQDLYRKDFETISEDVKFREIVNTVFSKDTPYFAVMNIRGEFTGFLSLNSIKKNFFEWDDLADIVIAKEIADRDFECAFLEHDCQEALDRMIRNRMSGLPVVDKEDPGKLLGMIWQKDILDAYHKEITRLNIGTTLLDRMHWKDLKQEVHFMEGYSLSEIPVPRQFIGQTLMGLDMRNRYGAIVLAVMREDKRVSVFPGPDFRFEEPDETMTIAGNTHKISILRSLN